MNKIISIFVVLIIYITYFNISLSANTDINDEAPSVELDNKRVSHYVIATKYNAVVGQCDNTPLITACNERINLKKLNNYELKWIAVSRDLRVHYPYGSKVLIECDNELLNGIWYVMDTMSPKWKKKIDFLVPTNDKYNMDKPIKVKITKL